MKNLILLLVLFTICKPHAFGQNPNTNSAKLQGIIPQEKIFIHYNSSILFPGEYLYYKLYNLNKESDNLSNISKIAYIELIDNSGKSIIKHKLNLNRGMGQGDFFIPTSLKSGNYKLVGYTKWMRNGGNENYFSGNITIINPYRNDQEAILSKVDTIPKTEESKAIIKGANKMDNLTIKLSEETSYGRRDKASFSIQNSDASQLTGNFSISVRKKDSLDLPKRITTENFLETYYNSSTNKDSTFLPDLRGDLYLGKIKMKKDFQDSLQPEKIAISIPGDNFSLKVSETDTEGNFHFILDDYGDQIFLQVIGENRNNYNIEINHESYFDFTNMKFEGLTINEKMQDLIIERSVYNQIENNYYSAKPDTLKTEKDRIPFYGSKKAEIYRLDDYTRFKTFKEVFIEIITNAKIRNDKDGNAVFEVYPLEGSQSVGDPALLLVDGVFVQDTQRLMDYDVLKVDEVQVVRDIYYYGAKVFSGIIVIQTRDNDFLKGFNEDFLAKENIINSQLKKSYFKPDYSQNRPNSRRIPDFRLQLLWEPNYKLLPNTTKEVEFYTSDVPGSYEISLEGFTTGGKAVSLTKLFTVE